MVYWFSVSPSCFPRSVLCLRGLAGCSLLLSEVSQLFLEPSWPLFNATSLFTWWLAIEECSLWASLPLSLLSWSRREGVVTSNLHPTTSCQRWLRNKPKNSLTVEGVKLCFWSWLCWGRWKEVRCWLWGMAKLALGTAEGSEIQPFSFFFLMPSWRYLLSEQPYFFQSCGDLIVILSPPVYVKEDSSFQQCRTQVGKV